MSQALLKVIANCGRCIQYEAKGQLPTNAAYHLYRTHGTRPHRLCWDGSYGSDRQEARSKECACGHRPFYTVCAGIRDKKSYSKDNSQGAV